MTIDDLIALLIRAREIGAVSGSMPVRVVDSDHEPYEALIALHGGELHIGNIEAAGVVLGVIKEGP